MNKTKKSTGTKQILEGSRAVALTIKEINPDVISAYPITPQTHIVEDLSKFKADGKANYEYVRAESEFAAASIIEGASATGSRVYSATSSQGILLMTEVLFNIAGMRLPVVLTCANRGVSAPITIWNDHQDSMTIRDSGWIMLFAENHQEAVYQHILAYKIAEQTRIPVMINIDGFVLTHSYEPVNIPTRTQIKKFLPDYKPDREAKLDPANPFTMGAFVAPAHYLEIREDLHKDLISSLDLIKNEHKLCMKHFTETTDEQSKIDNGLLEYYGPKRPQVLLVAMGSMAGTIKAEIDKGTKIGLIKLRTFRPFPGDEIIETINLTKSKYVAVLDKAISLGNTGPLAVDLKAAAQKKSNAKIQSFIVGLGGRDITNKNIKEIIKKVQQKNDNTTFIH